MVADASAAALSLASQALRLVAVGMLAYIVLALVDTPGGFAAPTPRAYINSSFNTLPNGQKVLDVKWALGPDRIRILRIPDRYRAPLMGMNICHPFSALQLDADCAHPFALTAALQASYPPLNPPLLDNDDKFLGHALNIEIDSDILAANKTDQQVFAERTASKIGIFVGHNNSIHALSPIYRLNVIGPDLQKNDILPASGPMYDAYFDGTDPSNSTILILCPDDIIVMLAKSSITTGESAVCTLNFSLSTIRSQVKVELQRSQVGMWQQLRSDLSLFLTSLLRD